MNKKSICRLCKKQSNLKWSHIIPEFLFKPLYDDKHRFTKISTSEDTKNDWLQKGIREQLLCDDCEQTLSKYERNASLVFKNFFSLDIKKTEKRIIYDQVNYREFKLFALSILWRAGVSSLNFFNQVNLYAHEENLREMLLNGLPGNPNDYPFLLCPIHHDGNSLRDLMIHPEFIKLENGPTYRFVFGGMLWVFVVNDDKNQAPAIAASLSESGVLTMLPKNITEIPFIVHMAQHLHKSGKV